MSRHAPAVPKYLNDGVTIFLQFREGAMKTRRRSDLAMRPLLGALLIFPAVLFPLTRATAEEQHQRSVAPVRQAPQPQTFTRTAPVQSVPPAGHQLYGQQYNPPGLNSPTSIRQYNPPGLQGSPNPNSPTMALPPGIGSTGGQTTSQGMPGPGGPGPGAAGSGGYGAAYPVGYQGPAGIQPPSSYQAHPAYARQFTCRTVHYICVVPYTGACQCENDRREREAGATVD